MRPLDEVGGTARDVYSWGHLPIIAGIIAFAVAIEQILGHADEALGGAALVAALAGIVLYLGGIAFALYHSGRRAVGPWLAATAVGVIVVWIASSAPTGIAALVALAVILVWFAAWGSWSRRPSSA